MRCEVVSRLVAVLDKLAPAKYAAKWDNVGVLVDAVRQPRASFLVFLCNDLTPSVLEEAVANKTALIITYHPTPFAGVKQLHLTSVPASIILACARANIAVYSPHTAWDVAPSGLNEWLARGVAAELPEGPAPVSSMEPVKRHDNLEAAAAGFGDGRVVTLAAPACVASVVEGVKRHLHMSRVQLCLPTRLQARVAEARLAGGEAAVMALAAEVHVTSYAVCGGSGSGVLPGCPSGVYITGEMGHHEVLAAAHAGVSVILTGHSNCERGYLPVFAERLRAACAESREEGVGEGKGEGGAPATSFPLSRVSFMVSRVDCDPLYVV